MIGFCPLASGSAGNCTFIGSENTKILLDVGLSAKMIQQRLNLIGVDLTQIDAILITHEHTDHIKGLAVVAGRFDIPILTNSETAKAIRMLMPEPLKFKIFSTNETFEFGDMEIRPFSIQHDAADPVAFTIRYAQHKVGFCTDLGFATTLVSHELQKCDYLILEANHEPSMVHASSRPGHYKKRVLSRLGHLSNGECADLLCEVFHVDLKHVHLAHLSSECNSHEVAQKIIHEKLQQKGISLDISIAYQYQVSRAVHFFKQG